MSLQRAPSAPRFVRRTSLGPGEYRKNFRQIDREIIEAVTSAESDAVTPLMSKIYLRLVNAPEGRWERDGVLRFESELREAGRVKAWSVLCEVLGVASATANKALRWMHGQGIIGYFAGKNGVGIRIFLNRASSSVGKKILPFPPASSGARRASPDETASRDSFADPEGLDPDFDPPAPKDGAEQTEVVKHQPDPRPVPLQPVTRNAGVDVTPPAALRVEVPIEEIVSRLSFELGPSLQAAARRAAMQEHERTREWLESKGLPKAARVAQREAYNVLRKYGVISEAAGSSHAGVGRSGDPRQGPRPLADAEIAELARACVAMLEAKGQSVEVTLSEMSAEAGGFLLPQDAARVREQANYLLSTGDYAEGK